MNKETVPDARKSKTGNMNEFHASCMLHGVEVSNGFHLIICFKCTNSILMRRWTVSWSMFRLPRPESRWWHYIFAWNSFWIIFQFSIHFHIVWRFFNAEQISLWLQIFNSTLKWSWVKKVHFSIHLYFEFREFVLPCYFYFAKKEQELWVGHNLHSISLSCSSSVSPFSFTRHTQKVANLVAFERSKKHCGEARSCSNIQYFHLQWGKNRKSDGENRKWKEWGEKLCGVRREGRDIEKLKLNKTHVQTAASKHNVCKTNNIIS